MKLKKNLFDYVENHTNWTIEDKNLDESFPIYIKASYDLWNSSISGLEVLFARVKDPSIGMTIHYNAIKKMQTICTSKVVLVFDSLDSRSINRLIERGISFVVQDKQIYMPFALMQIQTNNQSNIILERPHDLTADADMVLIGYLYGVMNNEMLIKDIAALINRELRATSNALKVLESLEYIHIEKDGRNKKSMFAKKLDIYERLKLTKSSFIKYTFFTNLKLENENFIKSGYSALSQFSTLLDNELPTISISEKKLSMMELDITKCEEEHATCKVEIWNRDPSIFSVDGAINPLYILRLFKDEDDERVEYAIESIEKKVLKNIKADV